MVELWLGRHHALGTLSAFGTFGSLWSLATARLSGLWDWRTDLRTWARSRPWPSLHWRSLEAFRPVATRTTILPITIETLATVAVTVLHAVRSAIWSAIWTSVWPAGPIWLAILPVTIVTVLAMLAAHPLAVRLLALVAPFTLPALALLTTIAVSTFALTTLAFAAIPLALLTMGAVVLTLLARLVGIEQARLRLLSAYLHGGGIELAVIHAGFVAELFVECFAGHRMATGQARAVTDLAVLLDLLLAIGENDAVVVLRMLQIVFCQHRVT